MKMTARRITRLERKDMVSNLAELINRGSIHDVAGMLDDAIELHDAKLDCGSDEAKHISVIRLILADFLEYIDRVSIIKSTNNDFLGEELFNQKQRVELGNFQADIAQITIK